jgi:predicted ATP-grasp superfamily ATP-dependent carboligase
MSARKPEGIGDFRISDCQKYNSADYSNRNPRSPIRNRSERPAKVLETVETFFDDVDARGVTKPDGAVVAKSSAWDDGDVRLAQQTVGEILRS